MPGKTKPVRTDRIRDTMSDKGISVADLVRETGLSRRGINNILQKVNDPTEDNLVLIARALGVKWPTLLEGYDGEVEEASGGRVAIKTTTTLVMDVVDGMTEEEVRAKIHEKLKGRVRNVDEVVISFVRKPQ